MFFFSMEDSLLLPVAQVYASLHCDLVSEIFPHFMNQHDGQLL